jgi:hypothetical protein
VQLSELIINNHGCNEEISDQQFNRCKTVFSTRIKTHKPKNPQICEVCQTCTREETAYQCPNDKVAMHVDESFKAYKSMISELIQTPFKFISITFNISFT